MAGLRKLINAITILLIFIVVLQIRMASSQQQWKFHLAFEDANQQRDTIWFIWDTTATLYGVDTALGEAAVELDYSKFNVWIPNFYGDTTKTQAHPYILPLTAEIGAVHFELPIIITWDSSMFHADYLPPEPVGWVNNATLYNDYFFFINNDPLNHAFNMTLTDSVIAPEPNNPDPWFWLPEHHFPIDIEVLQDPTIGFKENIIDLKSGINLYPNPNNGNFKLNFQQDRDFEFRLYNIYGVLLVKLNVTTNVVLDLSQYHDLAGLYIYLILKNNQIINSGKMIID